MSKVKCIDTPCKKCLVLDVSIEKSVLRGNELVPKNDVYYREVFALKCPLHGGFVFRVRASFHPFLRKVSTVRMSAIRRFHSKLKKQSWQRKSLSFFSWLQLKRLNWDKRMCFLLQSNFFFFFFFLYVFNGQV